MDTNTLDSSTEATSPGVVRECTIQEPTQDSSKNPQDTDKARQYIMMAVGIQATGIKINRKDLASTNFRTE